MTGPERHDSATMTVEQHEALWTAFFEAKRALEGADWPLARLILEHDGTHTLACPWCDVEFATPGSPDDAPDVHSIAVGWETTNVLQIGLDALPTLLHEGDFPVQMGESAEPETDPVGYECDACHGTMRIPGERIS